MKEFLSNERIVEAIKGKKFAVFGRAGIDLFCDEVGVKSENSQILGSTWVDLPQIYVQDW